MFASSSPTERTNMPRKLKRVAKGWTPERRAKQMELYAKRRLKKNPAELTTAPFTMRDALNGSIPLHAIPDRKGIKRALSQKSLAARRMSKGADALNKRAASPSANAILLALAIVKLLQSIMDR